MLTSTPSSIWSGWAINSEARLQCKTAADAAVVNMGFATRLVRQYCWHGIVNESLILIRNGESIRPRVMRAAS